MSLPLPGGRLPRWQLVLFTLAVAAAGCALVSWGALGAWQGLTDNAGSTVSAETSVAVPITSLHCSGSSVPYQTCGVTSGNVQLSWGAVSGSPAIAVYRASAPAGPFAEIAALPGTATGYPDTTAAYNSQYDYQVASGAVGWRPAVSAVDMALSLPPTGGTDDSSGTGGISFTAPNLSAMSVKDGVTYTTASTWGGGGAVPMENDQVNGVSCVTTTLCWAVGNSGAIWSTTDGGYTWSEQSAPGNRTLYGVDFVNASDGWAVGQSGTIYVTTNGGASWSKQTKGPKATLYGVDFVNTSDGWAVGQGGAIVATTDGGATWVTQTSGTAADLLGVSCVSATQCWAVGQNGTIIATTNGGATWSAQRSGTAQTLNAVSFVSTTRGWAVGDGGTILTTTNGGASWTAQASGTTQNLLSVSMVSTTTGWAVGAGGTILHTTSGGSTWTAQTSTTTQSLNAVSAVSSSFAMVGVTAGGVTPSALVTTDGGVNWYPPSAQYLEWTFSPTIAAGAPVTSAKLTLVDAASATATSPTQTYVLVSADGGTNWASFLIADPTTTMTTQVVDIGSVINSAAALQGLLIRYVCTEATGFRSIIDSVHVDIN